MVLGAAISNVRLIFLHEGNLWDRLFPPFLKCFLLDFLSAFYYMLLLLMKFCRILRHLESSHESYQITWLLLEQHRIAEKGLL